MSNGVHPIIIHGCRRFEVWNEGVYVDTFNSLSRARTIYLLAIRGTQHASSV